MLAHKSQGGEKSAPYSSLQMFDSMTDTYL